MYYARSAEVHFSNISKAQPLLGLPLCTQYILMFLYELDEFFFGVTDEGHEGVWTWLSDGTLAGTYDRMVGGLQFRNAQPDNENGIQNCGMLVNGQINDVECLNKSLYLCEASSTHFYASFPSFRIFMMRDVFVSM